MFSFNRILIIQFLLLLLPFSFSTYLEPEISQIFFINKIIENAHNERPIDTILLMRHGTDQNCILNNYNPVGLPALRFDQSTVVNIKISFNQEVLVLICLSEVDDSKLLTSLAQNLNWMRDTRIVMWLHGESLTEVNFNHFISKQSGLHNFVNVLLIHTTFMSDNVNGTMIPYRLQPFPSPTLRRIADINLGPIFPKINNNFHGKTAVILPDLLPPRSILSIDPQSGKEDLYGYSDKLIKEFATRHNISLKLQRPLREIKHLKRKEILDLIKTDQIDLPASYLIREANQYTTETEYSAIIEIGSVFILVPCGQVMSINEAYNGLKVYSQMVLVAYFMFAVIETLIVAATHRLLQQSYRFTYSTLVVNLRAFCGVLGLPLRLNRRRSTLSLQQIVLIMGLFGIIFNCVFNANLSTLLIKQPFCKEIKNLEELYESKLPVIAHNGFQQPHHGDNDEYFEEKIRPILTYMPFSEAQHLALTLNTSYAHLIYSKTWHIINTYQQNYKINALCTFPGLKLRYHVLLSGVFKNNSVYKAPFNEFVSLTHSLGMKIYWERNAGRKVIADIHPKIQKTLMSTLKTQEYNGIELKNLVWLFQLIGIFYGVAGMVFMGEIIINNYQKKRIERKLVRRTEV